MNLKMKMKILLSISVGLLSVFGAVLVFVFYAAAQSGHSNCRVGENTFTCIERRVRGAQS